MRRALFAIAALVLLPLAACGEDDTAGTAGEATSSSVTLPATTRDDGTTTTTADTQTRRCETVGFTENSEDAASDITATGLGCDEAEAFVRVAGRRTSSGGPQQVEVDGYSCVRTRTEQEPLPRSYYECRNGSKKVTFVRS